jgi:predicted DCC family thiol-disulfide oxidoreductase YuxK
LAAPNPPVLIFDGDCAFCTSSAEWIQRRLPAVVHVEPWQRIDLHQFGLTEQNVMTAVYWVDDRRRTYRGDEAIAKALVAAGGGWKPVGWLLQVPGVSLLAAIGYKIVSKNRHRLPGGTPACKLPQ